jgi:hypothetical protein
MKILQLFNKVVSEKDLEVILNCFGIMSLEYYGTFSKGDLKTGCVAKLNSHREMLSQYYLPCKAALYLGI